MLSNRDFLKSFKHYDDFECYKSTPKKVDSNEEVIQNSINADNYETFFDNFKRIKSSYPIKKRSSSTERSNFRTMTCKKNFELVEHFQYLADNFKRQFSFLYNDKKNPEDLKKIVYGTANYFSPEIILNDKTEEGYEDFWAIGVMIYYIYTNKLPFDSNNLDGILYNIINNRIDWRRLKKEACKDLVELVKGLLNKDITKRIKCLNDLKNSKYFKGIRPLY